MVEFAYMRVVNHVNSKYFSVVFHPTIVYNKVLVDDECGYTIFSKFLEMKRKLLRNFFSLSQISGVAPILKKQKTFLIAQFIINSFLLVKQIGQSV